jgi:hypothetical protein
MAPGVGGLLNQLMNRGGTPIPGRQTTSNSGTMPTGQPMGYPPNFDNTFSGPTSQPPAQQPPTPNVSTSETYNYPGTLGGYDQNGNPEMYNNGYYNDPHEYSYPDDGSLEYRQTTPNYGNLPTGGTGYRP